MAHTRSSVHVSVPVSRLIRDLILSMTTLDKGGAQLIAGQRKQVTLNRFYTTGDNIAARQALYNSANDANASTKDEKQIVLTEIQFQDSFDPVEYNVDWPFLRTTGPNTSPSPSPALVDAIINSVAENFNNTLEKMLWAGDTGLSGSLALFDGWIKKIDADADVVNADGTGFGSAVTATNVILAFERTYQAAPTAVKDHPAFGFMCSYDDIYLYEEALGALDYKGIETWEQGPRRFRQRPIIPTHGIPAGRIFAGKFSAGDDSELKVGIWADSDRFNLEFGKGHDLDDVWAYRMRCDIGVEYVYGKQITEFTPGV